MPTQTMTVAVPEAIYQRLEQRAQQASRSVEAELLEVLVSALPESERLSSDLVEASAALPLLDDEALWRAARSRLAADMATQLEDLHLKRQREGLTEAEAQNLAHLVRQYERAMLVRAQAAALLRQRGHDVTGLAANA